MELDLRTEVFKQIKVKVKITLQQAMKAQRVVEV
jgi:hypothetical protein